MLSTIRALVLAAAKPLAAIILGGAIIWEVAVHCGPSLGTVYVHVTGGDGDVMIDEETYHVTALEDSPIVRELRPGRHVVRMARDGRNVFQQEISIASGEEIVLTAWDSRQNRLPVEWLNGWQNNSAPSSENSAVT